MWMQWKNWNPEYKNKPYKEFCYGNEPKLNVNILQFTKLISQLFLPPAKISSSCLVLLSDRQERHLAHFEIIKLFFCLKWMFGARGIRTLDLSSPNRQRKIFFAFGFNYLSQHFHFFNYPSKEANGNRTRDLLLAWRVLCPLSYSPLYTNHDEIDSFKYDYIE